MQSLEMRVRCGKTHFRRPAYSAAGGAVMTALALVALLVFTNTAAAQNMWMHLLNPGVGWFGDPHELFWTTDNGQHWKDITPPGVPRAWDRCPCHRGPRPEFDQRIPLVP